MSLHATERIVAIRTAQLFCDLCSMAFPTPLPHALTLVRAAAEDRIRNYSAEACYTAAQIPATEEELMLRATEAGWRRVKVYGKALVICGDHKE